MIDNALEVRICTNCQQLNAADQLRCTNCNAMFPVATTRIIVDERKPSHSLLNVIPIPGKVILYIPREETPIILPNKSHMTIGRTQPDKPLIDIDLTNFGAQELGVSRNHAELTFTEESAVLEDAGSANGTWLNENRLVSLKPYALHNGDLMRFGNLMIFIYFSLEQALLSIPLLITKGHPILAEAANALAAESKGASNKADMALATRNFPLETYKPPEPTVNELSFRSTIDKDKQQHNLEIGLSHNMVKLNDEEP